MMEFNRNQYFLAGLVIFLLGIQLRMVDTIVLNERTTQFLAQRMQQMKQSNQIASTNDAATLFASQAPVGRHRMQPPK